MVKKARKRELKQLTIAQHKKQAAKDKEKLIRGQVRIPEPGTSFAHVRNKQKRSKLVRLMKGEQKRLKAAARRARKEAEARGETVERKTPRTIESMREPDETIVPPDDSEVEADEDMDEFEEYFKGDKTPKILMTTQAKCTKALYTFMKELIHVIPNCFYYPRRDFGFSKICDYASNKGFTDVILFSEKLGKLTGMYISHLPKGPTSFWRLTRLKLGQQIKNGATCNAEHNPELILNHFITRLGRRLGRQLAALFPQNPHFRGRRTVTFHNQRDYVFFRHYRYAFKDDGTKCKLQEIGPRFTLKCRYLQHGTFEAKTGEYEFIWRPDLQVSRKKFFT